MTDVRSGRGEDAPGPAARTRVACLAAAHGASTVGNHLNLVALGLHAYEVTGTGYGIGLVMALRVAAASTGGLVAGRLVTELDRRAVMIGANLVQAVAMTLLAAFADARQVAVVAAAVVALGFGNSMFSVALRTSVPEVTGPDRRVRVNGLLVSVRSAGVVVGFGSAGITIGAGGVVAAFVVCVLSFAASAVVLCSVRWSRGRSLPADRVRTPVGRLWTVVPGMLLALVVVRGVDALASSSHNIALPVIASTGGGGAALMTRFWLAWAVGAVLAHQLVSRCLKGVSPARLFGAGTCVMAMLFTVAFTGLAAPVLIGVVVLAGLADGITEIAYTSRLQEAPEEVRGRLFGLSATVEASGFAIGMVASGAALEVLPAVVVVALCHGFALCAAAVFLLLRCLGANDDDEDVEAGPLHRA